MLHLGNVPANSTLYIPFTSYGKTNGESITLTGLAVTDIEIYKNGSTTQRSSDAGYALLDTDGIDFDGVTGLHGFSVDLSDNTDAGFYAVGSFYWVVVSTVTIDSQTVTFIAATFRIVAAEGVTGKPKVDVDAFGGSAGTFASGIPETKVASIANNAITAASINADAITNAKIADDAIAVENLKDGAITAAKIASDAISNAKLADGAISSGKFAADAITAAKLHADVTTELQSGLATSAALSSLDGKVDTIDDFLDTEIASIITKIDAVDDFLDTEIAAILAAVDTEVAAIKAKTDQLAFGATNTVNANVTHINETEIAGAGVLADKWRPA